MMVRSEPVARRDDLVARIVDQRDDTIAQSASHPGA
jgi:hypothetical protein